MSQASALIQAMVGEHCPDAASAHRLLDTALELEVDPFDYCAARLQLGEKLVMERAAAWAGFPFADAIPPAFDQDMYPDRLEAIASAKVVTITTADKRWIYTAPNFLDVLRLQKRDIAPTSVLRSSPHRLCVTTSHNHPARH